MLKPSLTHLIHGGVSANRPFNAEARTNRAASSVLLRIYRGVIRSETRDLPNLLSLQHKANGQFCRLESAAKRAD